jgi:hypothetical protein
MKCWYCHKELDPGEWTWVAIWDGTRRRVCKDDRTCKPNTGIQGNGLRPAIRKQPKKQDLETE